MRCNTAAQRAAHDVASRLANPREAPDEFRRRATSSVAGDPAAARLAPPRISICG
ncbi:hypothetical protein A33K_16550 [Burkholderia humptydooensis MSMB43]|uniref:Uncharacterized protein n=1 Tax=Burkholderia humptydooensis MSMB43 TaxID=441157 RepID=A0ABN0G3V6_9BURK|nr:hypothetical protein A33K_16550 [Burkholderia humptydooensis MSMB43]